MHPIRKTLIVTELLKRAKRGETITYGELAKLIGVAPQGPWKLTLDEIGADERAAGRGDLACLVVKRDTGFPAYVGTYIADRNAALSERRRVFEAHRTTVSG